MPFLIFEPSPIPATSNRAPWRNSRERGRQARSRRSQPGPRGPCSGNVRARSAREFSPRSALGPARLVPARRRTVRASAQHPFWSPLPLHPTLSLSPSAFILSRLRLTSPGFRVGGRSDNNCERAGNAGCSREGGGQRRRKGGGRAGERGPGQGPAKAGWREGGMAGGRASEQAGPRARHLPLRQRRWRRR